MRALIPCQRGPYPPFATGVFLDLLTKGRVIIVTSSDVILADRSRNIPKIKGLVYRASIDQLQILNLRGFYGRLEFGGERLWVDRRWFAEVREIVGPR